MNVLESVLEPVRVNEVRWDAVVLSDGAVLPSGATVWTAGFGVPDLAARSGLRTDALGRLLTDETLTSIDDERVVAAGDPTALVNQAFVGQCISLGRSHGTVQLARTDDTPVNIVVGGRGAASIKEAICKGTLWAIRREAAKPGSYYWLKGGKRSAQLAAEQQVALG